MVRFVHGSGLAISSSGREYHQFDHAFTTDALIDCDGITRKWRQYRTFESNHSKCLGWGKNAS